jgi:hypothetical protein
VRDDLAEDGQQRRSIDRITLPNTDLPPGRVAVPVGDDAVGI